MKSKVKESFDAFFESQQLPSQQSVARMRNYRNKRAGKRPLPLYVACAFIAVSCLLWMIYSPPTHQTMTASVAEVESALQQYMTDEEIRHYTVVFEEEEQLRLLLLNDHPLTAKEIKQLKQLPIQVEEQFVWPRFPLVGVIAVWVLLASMLLLVLLSRTSKRLKAYTPLIMTLFTISYAGLGIYITEGYSGIAFMLFLMLASPLILAASIFLAIKWEYTQKKAQDE